MTLVHRHTPIKGKLMMRKILIIGNTYIDAEHFSETYTTEISTMNKQKFRHIRSMRKFVSDDLEVIYTSIQKPTNDGLKVDEYVLSDMLLNHGKMRNILAAYDIGRSATMRVNRKDNKNAK